MDQDENLSGYVLMSGSSSQSSISELSVCQYSRSLPSRLESYTFKSLEPFQFSTSVPYALEKLAISEENEFRYLMRESRFTMWIIMCNVEYVTVDMDMLQRTLEMMQPYIERHIMADNYATTELVSLRIKADYYPDCDEHKVDWLFVLHALNFSLYQPRHDKQWTVHGRTGFKALCFAIRRAIQKGKPMWNPTYYTNLKLKEMEVIFRSDDEETSIPLMNKRLKILHEIGKVLLDKYEGSFENCVTACNGDAFQLRFLLYKEFETYRDTVKYKGDKVYFGCKAATLISDLSYFNQVFGEIYPISTVFVDYCIPRVLHYLGILCYGNELRARFSRGDIPLEHGSPEEMEIRCSSLTICKWLSRKLVRLYKPRMRNMTFVEKLENDAQFIVDNFLWSFRHLLDNYEPFNIEPFHNIRSVYY